MARFQAAAIVAALATQAGCITLYSKTEHVRAQEARQPIRFESPEAAAAFQEALQHGHRTVGGTHVGLPFVTLYHDRMVLSEAAQWNDAVTRCDTDQDGVISGVEAAVFKTLQDK